MAAFRTVMILFGALAVLLLGVLPTAALAEAGAPPCHESMAVDGAGHHGPEAPSDPGKMNAMACCAACVVTPALQPPARAEVGWPAPAMSPGRAALPPGLSLAPETGPPRA